MKVKFFFLACIAALFCLPTVVRAEDSCQQPCPDGKVRISFADGNHTTCLCVEPGSEMVPTNPEGGPTCNDADDDGVCD